MVSNSMLLKRLCLLFGFILATTSTVYGGNSLFGLPIESPKANIHIEAVLIDLKTNEEWILTEDLAGVSELHGKIRVTHENKSIDIFYHEKYDDKRLIINDLECRRMDDQPSYWSRPLPDVRNQVKKMLIHLGPSVIYRLKSLKWKDSIEAGINGMKQRRANLDKTLSITASYKSNNTNDIDKLARLSFSDISGSSFGNKTSASLVLEIVSQTIVNENLDDRVEPTPGIGCPNYFHGDLSFPELKTRQLHFAATEQITNSNGTRKVDLEVYVDLDKKVTRIDMDQNFTINDFNLAVSYVFNHGKCSMTAFSDKVEGLIGGELNINELLWTNDQYKYVGKTVYEPRAQGVFDTWESIEYGRNIDGVKFDKVVTTQYMAKLSGPNDNKTSNNYIPVAVIRVGYNKDSMGKYQVHESRRRDILEFQRAITPPQYENLFQITDCFDPQERKYLTFDIRSENHDYSCNFVTQRAEENIYEFKESFKHLLTKNISPLRISSMNFNFQSDKISSTVEFLEKPALEKSFKKQDIQLRVGSKMFTQMFDAIKTKSLNECLKTQVANSFFRKILHCPSADGLCAQLDDPLNQTQDNGDPLTECSLYTFPLTIKVRLAKEYGLSHLHRELLGTKNMIFSMHCGNCSIAEKSLKYRMINVYDYNYFGDSSKEPRFTEIQKLHKLDPKVKSVQIVKGPIRDFADCYNSCASSLDGSCSTFTHCISGVSHECYTTVEPFTGNSTVFHPNCTTYARDYLIEYQKTPAKEFLDSNQREHLYSVSVADCATLCHRSNSCLTFQYCGNNVCSFAGPYTSKIIKPNSNCDIYVPKKSHEFMLTGESLVNQVISTVSGLNLEQCAALCFDWKYGNESCTSFNYCPTGRSESTCALTKYSVGDSTVETTASNYCFNFELIKSRTRKHKGHAFLRNEELGNAGTSISLAFLVVGLALGVAITSMYHTFHNRHKYRVTSADQESND